MSLLRKMANSLRRFVIVCVVAVVVTLSDLTAHFVIAFAAATVVGAFYFLIGAANGGMRPIGLAAPHLMPKDIPKPKTDPNAGVGSALAAAGIASSVVSNHHYPLPFRVFYGFCIAAGLVIALVLAWRGRGGGQPNPP